MLFESTAGIISLLPAALAVRIIKTALQNRFCGAVFICTFLSAFVVYPRYKLVHDLVHERLFIPFLGRLIHLRACRNLIIQNDEIQHFFAVILVDAGQKHAVAFFAHHLSRRKVCDGNRSLADQFFRFIISVNTRKNDPVCAASIVKDKLQKLLTLCNLCSSFDFHCY